MYKAVQFSEATYKKDRVISKWSEQVIKAIDKSLMQALIADTHSSPSVHWYINLEYHHDGFYSLLTKQGKDFRLIHFCVRACKGDAGCECKVALNTKTNRLISKEL